MSKWSKKLQSTDQTWTGSLPDLRTGPTRRVRTHSRFATSEEDGPISVGNIVTLVKRARGNGKWAGGHQSAAARRTAPACEHARGPELRRSMALGQPRQW